MKVSVVLSGFLMATMVMSVQAQSADVQNGRQLARKVCAECHAVLPEEKRSPNAGAPTFQELARTPGMTTMALSVAFSTPHAGMPMFQLTSEQAADIIAYILGLRAELPGPGGQERQVVVERTELSRTKAAGLLLPCVGC
jgi:mono/diheme cytochrome c family protein